MAKKIVMAGVLGGIVLFLWQWVSHMLLPLGDAGIKRMENEEAVIAALQPNIPQPGFYFFPAPDNKPGMSSEQK